MTRTPRQKAYRRVNREYSQFKDVPLLTKAYLLVQGIDYYKDCKNKHFEEQDHENVAMMRNIVEELSSNVLQIDFTGWIDNVRNN